MRAVICSSDTLPLKAVAFRVVIRPDTSAPMDSLSARVEVRVWSAVLLMVFSRSVRVKIFGVVHVCRVFAKSLVLVGGFGGVDAHELLVLSFINI